MPESPHHAARKLSQKAIALAQLQRDASVYPEPIRSQLQGCVTTSTT